MIALASRLVTVCAACLTASCFKGAFRCDRAIEAGIERKSIDELRALDREHPDFWEEERPCR